MASTTWKQAERRVAKDFGLERVGNTGKSTPDAEGPKWCIEVKWRTKLPEWLWSALQSIRSKAKSGQTPLVVLMQRRRKNKIVLMDYDDFLELVRPE